MTMHTGEKSHKCSQCDIGRAGSLKVHIHQEVVISDLTFSQIYFHSGRNPIVQNQKYWPIFQSRFEKFNDLDPMLQLIPSITFLLFVLAYSWMNNNKVKEEKEPGRRQEELAPAWLMIILHGLSELHAKVALEVEKKIENT